MRKIITVIALMVATIAASAQNADTTSALARMIDAKFLSIYDSFESKTASLAILNFYNNEYSEGMKRCIEAFVNGDKSWKECRVILYEVYKIDPSRFRNELRYFTLLDWELIIPGFKW